MDSPMSELCLNLDPRKEWTINFIKIGKTIPSVALSPVVSLSLNRAGLFYMNTLVGD